jgi:glycosyltransferase EpsD
LVTAHLGRHFKKFGHYDYKVLLDMGHEVHIAANFNDKSDDFGDERVIKHQIDFQRSPLSLSNLHALKQLQKLFNSYYFDIIHCQSPSGGVITRLAARQTRRNGSKILYTAHGFHFYAGAPLTNWILYYSIEKIMSYFTDCIVTINEEDYGYASKKLRPNCTKYIPGVGIDLHKFQKKTNYLKIKYREEYGFRPEDFILICIGELNYNKHQDLLIKSMKLIVTKIPGVKLLLVGEGSLSAQYNDLVADLELKEKIEFLGYRSDISKLMIASDVGVSSSRREGLPLNIMEAMATGLPIIATDCRGNRELVQDEINGFIVGIEDEKGFANAIEKMFLSQEKRERFGENSFRKVKKYSLENVTDKMQKVYGQFLDDNTII